MAGAVAQRSPQPGAYRRDQQRYRQQEEEIWQAKPALGDGRLRQRGPDADGDNYRQQRQQQTARGHAHIAVERILALHHQPAGAQQRIRNAQSQAAEQGKRRKPVKHPAAETAAADREAVDHRADNHPLGEGGQNRTAHKGAIPERAVRWRRVKAEFKSDAAENKPDQHQGEGDRQRIDNYRIGQWKSAKQPRAAEHQPGLVAIPDRRDAVHHDVAIRRVPRGTE